MKMTPEAYQAVTNNKDFTVEVYNYRGVKIVDSQMVHEITLNGANSLDITFTTSSLDTSADPDGVLELMSNKKSEYTVKYIVGTKDHPIMTMEFTGVHFNGFTSTREKEVGITVLGKYKDKRVKV